MFKAIYNLILIAVIIFFCGFCKNLPTNVCIVMSAVFICCSIFINNIRASSAERNDEVPEVEDPESEASGSDGI